MGNIIGRKQESKVTEKWEPLEFALNVQNMLED